MPSDRQVCGIMPLQSAHVFASHIGHTGKTTLSFQMSCYYAKRHPEVKVLVFDLAEEGDLTKRFLGGVDAANAKIDEVFGTVFKLIEDAKKPPSRGLTSWWRSDKPLDILASAVQVSAHNKAIPENLYLISSGAWPKSDEVMEVDVRQRVVANIQEALNSSEATWKVFCDTDGDRRPSTFTKIAYGLCQHAIVPLHLNKGDLDRTETMLGVMNELRAKGEISVQVLFIVWNFVKSTKDAAMEHKGSTLPFTPSKVNLDILDSCNRRLVDLRSTLPGLFVHESSSDDDFVQATTTILRELADNILKPSEELGRPFVQMVDEIEASGKKTMKFTSGDGVEYTTTKDGLMSVNDSLLNVQSKFEAMTISAPASGGYQS